MSNLESAIKAFKNNEISIINTDTIYGFSSKVSNENRYKINEIKNSPKEKQLLILVSNLTQLNSLAVVKKKYKEYILKSEATTFILKARKEYVNLNLLKEKIAIRYVGNEKKYKELTILINEVGPIYSTSVNISGEDHNDDERVIKKLFEKTNLFVLEIPNQKNKPSNIIDLTQKQPIVVRGEINFKYEG